MSPGTKRPHFEPGSLWFREHVWICLVQSPTPQVLGQFHSNFGKLQTFLFCFELWSPQSCILSSFSCESWACLRKAFRTGRLFWPWCKQARRRRYCATQYCNTVSLILISCVSRVFVLVIVRCFPNPPQVAHPLLWLCLLSIMTTQRPTALCSLIWIGDSNWCRICWDAETTGKRWASQVY